MRKLLWLSLREIFNHRQFTILFSLNLSLGLSGFIALNSFRYSIEKSLSARSKIVLGADLGLSSRLPLSKDVLELASRSLPNSAPGTPMSIGALTSSQSTDRRRCSKSSLPATPHSRRLRSISLTTADLGGFTGLHLQRSVAARC
jgi:hypothetical protein